MSTTSEVIATPPSRRKRKVMEPEAAGNRETIGEDGEKANSYTGKHACVAWRQRKIRCSTNKPACAYCVTKNPSDVRNALSLESPSIPLQYFTFLVYPQNDSLGLKHSRHCLLPTAFGLC